MSLATATAPSQSERAIAEFMSYEHPELVHRLATENGWTEDEAREVFNDTLRFLYLCSLTGEAHSPTKRIDIGWHTFILFTRDYATFCERNFGRFLHHQPTPKLTDEGKGKDCCGNCVVPPGDVAHCYRSCTSQLSGNRDPVPHAETLTVAGRLFGALSTNWRGNDVAEADCCSSSDCTPVSCYND